jgi:hypothetical protein
VRVFFLARPPTEMRCRCRPRTWGGGVGCETVLTGERDDKTHHGVAGEGEEANLGFRVRVGSEGLTGAEILGFRVWEGSPELKVVGLRGMSRGGGPAVGAERGMGGGEAARRGVPLRERKERKKKQEEKERREVVDGPGPRSIPRCGGSDVGRFGRAPLRPLLHPSRMGRRCRSSHGPRKPAP